jgi:hypothetical protein
VDNIAMNVERWCDGEKKHEIDVAANYQGRMFVFDCKLTDEEFERAGKVDKVTTQISRAADTRRELTGLSGRLVLIRPNRRFDKGTREVVKASGLEVIDSRDAPFLLCRLATVLGVTLTPDLQQAEQLVHDSLASSAQLYAYGRAKKAVRALERSADGPDLLNLDAALKEWKEGRQQNWVAATFRGKVIILADNQGQTEGKFKADLQQLFQTAAAVDSVETSNTAGSYRIVLVPIDKLSRVMDVLKTRRGLPLLA